jgi:phage N-6-adenine-methyltransferase
MTLVAHRAANHRLLAVDDRVDDRRTPDDLFARLHALHRFTLDVAASPDNAKLPRFLTIAENALEVSWAGERVWCNPPYSRIEPWLVKAWAEVRDRCELVALLLPNNRCEQPFWQRHVEPFRDGSTFYGVRCTARFLAGRPKFGYPHERPRNPKGYRPPFGVVLVTLERAA